MSKIKWERYRSSLGVGLFWSDLTELYATCPPGTDPTSHQCFIHHTHSVVMDKHREMVEAVIQAYAEDGMVCYIESGRDCDCVEYDGKVHGPVPATAQAYEELDTLIGEWADGPYHLALCRPSEVKKVKYESRDLVMEAHEDGHPHSIVSRFP